MTVKKEQLVKYMSDLDREKVLALSGALMKQGAAPDEVFSLLSHGLDMVHNNFKAGRYFMADIIYAGSIFQEAVRDTLGQGEAFPAKVYGKVLIGTVQGDIHEIGKKLVALILEHNGFLVEDLGADVSPEKFLDAIMVHTPEFLVMSGTISGSAKYMERTIKLVERQGLRHCVRVILGGGCVDEKGAYAMGADAYAQQPTDCLAYCRQISLGTV